MYNFALFNTLSKNKHMSDIVPRTINELLNLYDTQFLNGSYRLILGRIPDQEGFNYYLNRIKSGVRKEVILSQLRLSDEGRLKSVNLIGLDDVILRSKLLKIPFIGKALSCCVTIKKKHPLKKKQSDIVCIIPYYNGSKFIERALISIYKQTVLPDEVVVVDDGSRVDERDFLIELNKKYSFHLVHKINGGQGSARNTGVAESSSKYICFLDQDDFYLPRHNEILLKGIPADEPDFGWVYGDLIEADGDGLVKKMDLIKECATHPKRDLVTMLREDMFVLPSASLINRRAFEDVDGFDEQFTGYEDDDLFLRLYRKGWGNTFIDKSVYTWCMHNESTSYTIKMARSRFRYLKKMANLYPDDVSKKFYYFRDLLIPRFGPQIIEDAIKAKETASKDCDELFDILNQYYEMVQINGTASDSQILDLKNLVESICE